MEQGHGKHFASWPQRGSDLGGNLGAFPTGLRAGGHLSSLGLTARAGRGANSSWSRSEPWMGHWAVLPRQAELVPKPMPQATNTPSPSPLGFSPSIWIPHSAEPWLWCPRLAKGSLLSRCSHGLPPSGHRGPCLHQPFLVYPGLTCQDKPAEENTQSGDIQG